MRAIYEHQGSGSFFDQVLMSHEFALSFLGDMSLFNSWPFPWSQQLTALCLWIDCHVMYSMDRGFCYTFLTSVKQDHLSFWFVCIFLKIAMKVLLTCWGWFVVCKFGNEVICVAKVSYIVIRTDINCSHQLFHSKCVSF